MYIRERSDSSNRSLAVGTNIDQPVSMTLLRLSRSQCIAPLSIRNMGARKMYLNRSVNWAADRPEVCDAVVGAERLHSCCLQIDFRVGGKFLCCMRSPGGQEFWNAGEYREIVPYEKIVSSMYFAGAEENKVEPKHYGIGHPVIDDVHDVTLFWYLGNGQPSSRSLAMSPWRTQQGAVSSRVGSRYSIRLRSLSRS